MFFWGYIIYITQKNIKKHRVDEYIYIYILKNKRRIQEEIRKFLPLDAFHVVSAADGGQLRRVKVKELQMADVALGDVGEGRWFFWFGLVGLVGSFGILSFFFFKYFWKDFSLKVFGFVFDEGRCFFFLFGRFV